MLSGTSLDPTEMRYVFKMVKRIQPASDAQVNGTSEVSDEYVGVGDSHVMSFDIGDVAQFSVTNVVLDKSQSKAHNGKLNRVAVARLLTLGRLFIGIPHRHRYFRQHWHPRTKSAAMGTFSRYKHRPLAREHQPLLRMGPILHE